MAQYTDKARARILAARPEAAAWIGPAGARRSAPTMPNKHAGPCRRCHGHVAEGAGVLAKDGGKWIVFHADGTCPDKQTPTATPATTVSEPRTGRPNKFAGPCITCGARVEAEAGVITKTDSGWKPAHHDGQCLPTPNTTATQTAPARAERPAPVNQYGGRCPHCGQWVEEKAGIRVKVNDRWAAAHHRGQCPDKESEDFTGGERIELTEAQLKTLPIGYYTVELDGGEYRSFRIRTKRAHERNPGRTEISYLGGPNNMSDYWLLGIVTDGTIVTRKINNRVLRDTLDVLIGDPRVAQLGYAQRFKHCYVCGQPLSTPESLALGIGPDCLNK